MAPRKKTKAAKKTTKGTAKNGGPRLGAGRKPVEAHFESLWKRLDTIDDALTALLQHVLPEMPSKAQEADPRQAELFPGELTAGDVAAATQPALGEQFETAVA